ncbi:COG2426 family protein [Chloroflexota bacterium]
MLELLTVIMIAASPISELRGAIPVAFGVYHFPWYWALFVSVIGNLLPVPFILLFARPAITLLSRFRPSAFFIGKLLAHVTKRSNRIERYERIGLALFVAVPLPVTGAWTGSLAAVFLGFKFRHSFISIAVGVVIAGIVVTGATMFGLGIWNLLQVS